MQFTHRIQLWQIATNLIFASHRPTNEDGLHFQLLFNLYFQTFIWHFELDSIYRMVIFVHISASRAGVTWLHREIRSKMDFCIIVGNEQILFIVHSSFSVLVRPACEKVVLSHWKGSDIHKTANATVDNSHDPGSANFHRNILKLFLEWKKYFRSMIRKFD